MGALSLLPGLSSLGSPPSTGEVFGKVLGASRSLDTLCAPLSVLPARSGLGSPPSTGEVFAKVLGACHFWDMR
eukprot:1159760-Pelagomonas_calceolata.AAC.4